MAVFFNEGEIKKRPGVFQRYSNTGFDALTGGRDGICAIPVQASWCIIIANFFYNFNSFSKKFLIFFDLQKRDKNILLILTIFAIIKKKLGK